MKIEKLIHLLFRINYIVNYNYKTTFNKIEILEITNSLENLCSRWSSKHSEANL